MYEIEGLFSEELTNLTNEQLKKLLNIKTDDNVLEMFTQTTKMLKTKDDNRLTAIFDNLILAEDHDKARRNKHAIKKAAIHTVSSNVEVVSNIEKSAKDIVNTTINKNKISKAVGHDETTPRLRYSTHHEGLIPTFIDLSQDVTPIETAAIRAVNYAVEEGYVKDDLIRERLHLLEKNAIEKGYVKDDLITERLRPLEKNAIEKETIKIAAIHEVNYAVEKGYVNHYPRKQVGIQNEYNGGKVICYANSVLQMFYSLPYYRTIISDFNNDSHHIQELFNQMNSSKNNFVSPTKIGDCPSNVYAFVNKMHKPINVIQEDANEYLQYLLENLQVDAVNFKEFTKKQCNNEKYRTEHATHSVLNIQVSGGSTIKKCIENYSNEDMVLNEAVIDRDKKGIKELMFENLNKTISQLHKMIPENDKGLLYSLNKISSGYDDSAIIINLLYFTNDNNKIILLGESFESYITFNKVLYNIFNEIKSKDETVFIDGCIKYPESIESIEEYIKENDDYLVVIKNIIKDFIIPPENRYLFIQLKRFHQNDDNTIIKLTNNVVPDKTLSIDGITYTLSGVIFHIGEYESGHYMYIQCNQLGEYHILYDDDEVYNYMENASAGKYYDYGKESINEKFINNNGYLFSYSRYPVDQDVNKKQDEETDRKQEETRAKVEEEARAKVEEETRAKVEEESRKKVEETAREKVEETRKKVEETRKNVEEAARAKVADEADELEQEKLNKRVDDATTEINNFVKQHQAIILLKKQEEEARAKVEEARAKVEEARKQEEEAAALLKKKQEKEAKNNLSMVSSLLVDTILSLISRL
jgi:hypothetical protein